MPKATALKQYVTAANKLLSTYGKSFHWARYFLGKETGLQATQLYAFCRYLDDIADQPGNLGAKKLKSIQNIFNNYSYQTGSYPEVDNFLLLRQELDLPVFAVKDLLEGLISDQETVLLLNENQLIQYSYKVAGTVGLMMAPILGISSKKAIPFAVDLGIAMQLTNISRDVLEDSKNNRFYIEKNFEKISSTVNLANRYYQDSFYAIKSIPISFRFSILVARRVYRKIGYKILKKKNLENYQRSGKIYVSNIEKVLETFLSIFDLISLYLINKNEDQIQHNHILINEEINLNERI